MAHCFTIRVCDEIAAVLRQVESTLASSGGSLDGSTESGSFSGSTPLGRIKGEYHCLSLDEIKVTILDKPFLLPYGTIESEIRKYFGV
jgi:hypothetical protein